MLLNEECLKEGSDVFLHCSIRGFPRPDIEFQLNGVTIIPGNGNFKNYVLEFYDQVRTNCDNYKYRQIEFIV